MLKHINISIFVPNNGCPHMCSFCDQFRITGTIKQPTEEDIKKAFENANLNNLYGNNPQLKRELAFFGGSFTAIEKSYMKRLLSCAYSYIESGDIDGIRISTRPDCINEKILKILKSYRVTSIELGAQSMDDEVLFLNNRGHTSDDVRLSSEMIKFYGFELGLQMMTGLYMSNINKDIYTAKEFIKLKPSSVRIYPTLVMKGTKLNNLYKEGKYIPQKLDDAIDLCVKLLGIFEKKHINVIRVGLHSSDGIKNNYVCGPWHPAFRELCESKNLVQKCIGIIKSLDMTGKPIQIFVCPRDVSKIVGHRKCGIEEIKKFCSIVQVKSDKNLISKSIVVKELKNL